MLGKHMRPAALPSYFYYVLCFLYAVSGLAALAYEILWVRMLGLQFGASIFGVTVTVAAFMAGLGLGSLLGLRLLSRLKTDLHKTILLYIGLELDIAFSTALLAFSYSQVYELTNAMAQQTGAGTWLLLQFVLSGFLLTVPAILMGVGFPLVLEIVKRGRISLGSVYGVNTLGAAIGVLLPLLLLPWLGWQKSLLLLAFIMLALAALVWLLYQVASRTGMVNRQLVEPDSPVPQMKQPANDVFHPHISQRQLYWGYAAFGLFALVLEVAWTRLFGMLFLRTEYVLALILVSFLIGIGSGSLLARYLKQRYWYLVLPILACSGTLMSLWLLPIAGQWVDYEVAQSLGFVLLQQVVVILLLTLPVTLVFGAWLPLLARSRQRGNEQDDQQRAARLYGVNSLGAGLGAILAGFVLTPWLGTAATIVLAAVAFLVLGCWWLADKKLWLAAPVAVLLAVPLYQLPTVAQLLPASYAGTRDIYQHEDALAITHVLQKGDGQRLLLADLQRMDASSDPSSVIAQRNQVDLPLKLHPAPQQLLLLGLGTGISAGTVLSQPGLEVTAVELSRGAIVAARQYFTKVNHGVVEHIKVVKDDARHFLLSDQVQYDVIVGDLFHPDLVGRSALLSVQQFERARARLKADGLFVQWLALNQFDLPSLEIVLRTFEQVFSENALFIDGFRIAMVGYKSTGEKGLKRSAKTLVFAEDQDKTQGQAQVSRESGLTWGSRYWGKIQLKHGKVGAVLQDEWAPVLEYRLPRSRYNGELNLGQVLAGVIRWRPTPEQTLLQLGLDDAPSESRKEAVARFLEAYKATGLIQQSWLAMLSGGAQSQGRERRQSLLKQAYQANPQDRWIAFALADAAMEQFYRQRGRVTGAADEKRFLQSLLKIREDHPEAIKRLWQLAKQQNNVQEADQWRQRLALISPYDADLSR